jgi:hypothetical protein
MMALRHEHLWNRLIAHMVSSKNAPRTWGRCDENFCRWHIKGWTAPAELAAIRAEARP